MLKAQAVAKILGLSARAVYAIPASALPRYQFGRAVRYDEADVAAYKAASNCGAPTPRPLRSARVLREYERLRLRAAAVGYFDMRPLAPEEHAIAYKRVRRQRAAPWADKTAIQRIYAEARRLTKETGVAHHVDHIVPLQGEFVSGLHVETNLRVMVGSENIRKRNRFEGE